MSPKPETVCGRIPVIESLRAGKRAPRRLLLLKGAKGLEAIRAAAGEIPVVEVERRELDRMTGGVEHQGTVLETGPLPLFTLAGWLDSGPPEDAIVVLLDGVEDPRNFGAIIRSAAALGAHAVVYAKDRSAPLSSAAVKAAAGAAEHLDLVRETNLVRSIAGLQQAGFWVAGLDAAGEQRLWEADLRGRVVLAIGSEGKGLRRLVLERCDFRVRIPLSGAISSLNASVCAAVALAECARQRV